MSDRNDPPNIRDWLVSRIAERLGATSAEVATDRPFDQFGLSSRDAVVLSGELGQALGRTLPATLLWEYPTIDRLAEGLDAEPDEGVEPAVPTDPGEPIAVIGLGCRFPGARGPDGFWRMLRDGVDGVSSVPEGRWESFARSRRDLECLRDMPSAGGFLDDVDAFDAEFFGISPNEAEVMDPQQRLLLEVAWEALEHAGQVPRLSAAEATGVFVGVSSVEYGYLTASDLHGVDAWTGPGAALSIVANRLSYFLDLRGPSMAVDTACSSSLVAVHQACASLRSGESRTALAGGVNALLSPAITANFAQAGGLAADGRCKAFAAAADGIVRGEGCGVIVLKRLSDAHRDGDRVLSVLRGSAVNSDGRSNGITAPNPAAQKELLQRCYGGSDVDPSVVDYVEAHGTGTLLGDPIEADALSSVLGQQRQPDRPLLLGSVKTNIGHLEAAAGVAGLIKVVLAMRHGQLPPSLHYDQPNPHIPFERSRLEVVSSAREWPKYSGVARAGVSGFGFGGTNAHVVLESWPVAGKRRRADDGTAVHELVVSGTSEARMRSAADRLADFLSEAEPAPAIEDVAYTLAERRALHRYRGCAVGRDDADVIAGLRRLAGGDSAAVRGVASGRQDALVWVFSGYGSHWSGMCQGLLRDEPSFATAVDALDPEFTYQCGFSLRAALSEDQRSADVGRTQLVLFGLQVALAELWRAHGVRPAAVLGHSMGEVTAAVVSGALEFSDGLRVMVVRSRVLSEVDAEESGAMAMIESSSEEVVARGEWFPGVTVAVHTSPNRCTVAGPADEVERMVEHAQRRGRSARALPVSGAGHTEAVAPGLDGLRADLGDLSPEEPSLVVYSTAEDDPRRTPSFDAHYWARNLRNPVRFEQAVRAAAADGFSTFLEISPHPIAAIGIEETLSDARVDDRGGVADALVVSSCRRNADDAVTFHENLARLRISERAPMPTYARGRQVDLPLPRWQHARYWKAYPALGAAGHPLLGSYVDLPDGKHAWRANVGAESIPWMTDHRVHDTAVLPGTAYVEMTCAAAREVFGADATGVRVEQVRLHELLPLDDRVPVTTTLTTTGLDSARVEVHSKGTTGKWACHASAVVQARSSEPGVLGAVSESVEAVDLYGSLRSAGQHYGPAFRGVREARAAGGTAITEVELPEQAGHLGEFDLHPALLDACLHGLVAAALGPDAPDIDGLPVPVEIGDVALFRRLPPRVRCYARLHSGGRDVTGSVLVTDEHELPVLEIGTVRAQELASTEAPVSVGDAFWELAWSREPAPEVRGGTGSWLVIGGADELSATLRAAGDRVITAEPHKAEAALEELAADPDQPARGVVVAVSAEGDIDAASEVVLELARIARLLACRADLGARLWTVTTAGHPASWGLRAMVRVLAVEHPELRASVVHADGASVESLVDELRSDAEDDEILRRDTDRRVARLRRARLDHVDPEHVVQPGAFVISGGLGGIGLTVAEWLAARGASRVVLNARNAPSAEAEQVLDRLRGSGTEVEIVTGDVSEAAVARSLMKCATGDGTSLRGVVHAAGALEDAAVEDLDEGALKRVWRPKVWGAWQLHVASAELNPDWWVVFSSAAGVLGSPGQAAYATANAWMDELVRHRRGLGLPATTVQWGLWSEVGGASDALSGALGAINPDEGVEALEAILSSRRAATCVARFDAASAREFFPGIDQRPFFREVLPTSAGTVDAVPTTVESADDVLRILTGSVSEVLGWRADALDVDTPLTMLGMDSLTAMRAKNAAERDLGTSVPPSLLLRGASLAEIANGLAEQLGLSAASRAERPRVIGPRDATERWVAHLWRHVLDRETVGVTDDFFAIGGDAALAEKITSQVGERLGQQFAATELFAEPTIERMSDLLRDEFENCDGPMRTLSHQGSRPPLFLFHPAGGPTSVYEPLVRQLGGDQPCYGFERVDDIPVLEDKARYYLELIQEVQPTGPYRLAGWSLGGCLAYETANQLVAAGHEVEIVALIDTILPLPAPDQSRAELLLRRYERFAEHIERTYGHAFDLPFEEISRLDEDEQIERIMAALSESDIGLGEGVLRHQYTSYVDARVAERYDPPRYSGRVVLYRAQEPEETTTTLDPRYLRTDEALGWDALADRLEVVLVPGNHLSMIDPPNVEVIAKHLGDALAGGGPDETG